MGYNVEKNVQMLIYLMKKHGVKKVIASPGATNVTFVGSLQSDPYFEIYSAVDERSAAYIACGMAAESGEAVAISCTGATASRNYVPALTEAYYRKLPVLAITSTQYAGRIGHLVPQVIDRSVIQNDIAVESVYLNTINTEEEEWDCNVKINRALLALHHHGGGPVHINLETMYSGDFSVTELNEWRVINRIERTDDFPEITGKKVGIFVGAHARWNAKEIEAVDAFCEKYNAVVFCDHTSNYNGKYRIQYNLQDCQQCTFIHTSEMDLLIDIGEVSGAYMSLKPADVWRVSLDGKIKDPWKKISKIFEMSEYEFFSYYACLAKDRPLNTSYYDECAQVDSDIRKQMPELPFSNAWVAQHMSHLIPADSILHLGILNSLRNWNFFHVDESVTGYCNTGGFGIDGIMSTFLGSSLASPKKLHFCVLGDLAFFYDMNALANHHVNANMRILLINNGCGAEFKNYSHFAARFGDDADPFIAAKGHHGRKSKYLVKHYAEDLGFKYLSAENKEEFLQNVEYFVSTESYDAPVVFEVFTDDHDESAALWKMHRVVADPPSSKDIAKNAVKNMLGENGVSLLKKVLRGSK